MRLDSKKCIVTGGASGIGRAAAVALAREGASVVVSDVEVSEGRPRSDLSPTLAETLSSYAATSRARMTPVGSLTPPSSASAR